MNWPWTREPAVDVEQTAVTLADGLDRETLLEMIDLDPTLWAVIDVKTGVTIFRNAAAIAVTTEAVQASPDEMRRTAQGMVQAAQAAGGLLKDYLHTHASGEATRMSLKIYSRASGQQLCLASFQDATGEVRAREQAVSYQDRMAEIQEVGGSMQAAAGATEQMTASINEIARNSNEAASTARSAVEAAQSSTAAVSRLGEASLEISKVIKVIGSIAAQTNLLALNATIEAARAGEAGRGFAVVASEVKDLARETATATDEIGRLIGGVQTETSAAVEAMENIVTVIDRINEIQSSIAAAVEEQTATTREITLNVTNAARQSNSMMEFLAAQTHQAGEVAR
jgi:methyl-accepting chemotaxis protein